MTTDQWDELCNNRRLDWAPILGLTGSEELPKPLPQEPPAPLDEQLSFL